MKILVKNIVKEYNEKIKEIQDELNGANKVLEETENKYKQSNFKNVSLEIKIESHKAQQDCLKKEIVEYEVKISKVNEFNEEVMKILEKLKNDVKDHTKNVEDLIKKFDEEKMALKKEIQDLKTKHSEEISKKNEDLAKKDADLSKDKEEIRQLKIQLKLALNKNLEEGSFRNKNIIKTNESSHFRKNFEHKTSSKPIEETTNLQAITKVKTTLKIMVNENLRKENTTGLKLSGKCINILFKLLFIKYETIFNALTYSLL